MQFIVAGLDQDTGRPVEMTFDAADLPSAVNLAARKGIIVRAVRTVNTANHQPFPPTSASPHSFTASPSPTQFQLARPAPPSRPARPTRSRWWLGVPLLLLPFLAPVWPSVLFWSAVGLTGLVLLYLLLGLCRRIVGAILGVSPNRPVRRGLKLAAILLYALALFGLAEAGEIAQRARAVAQARVAAEQAEQKRREAEANSAVNSLVQQAHTALQDQDLPRAQHLLVQAAAIKGATNLGLALRLQNQVKNASNKDWVLDTLVMLNDEAFAVFHHDGQVPRQFDLGFPVLTDRAVALAQDQFEQATTKRAERQQQQAAAAEALPQQQLAQAEAQLQADRDAAAAKQAAHAAGQNELRRRLDAYMAVLETSKVTVVERVNVRKIATNTWEAELTVRDHWHLRHYQIRLQDAQTLWKAWALVASPHDLDSARIKLIDHNGNEVGGSRLLGGSLIWVQDD